MRLVPLPLIALLLSALMFTGCGPMTSIDKLQLVVTASIATVAGLAAAGTIAPADAILIERALAGVPGAVTATTAEMSSTVDSDTVKSIKIAAIWAPELDLLKSLPPQDQVWVNAVIAAVNVFLATVPAPTTYQPHVNSHLTVPSAAQAKHLQQINVKAAILDLNLLALKMKLK